MEHARVDILGENYTIRGDAQTEYISQVGNIVGKRMQELRQVSPHLNPKRLAVLTAINLADELIRLQNDKNTIDTEHTTARRTSELISLIDEGLMANSPL